MNRALCIGVLMVASSGCATITALKNGDPVGAALAINHDVKSADAAAKEAAQKCDEAARRPISYEEEVAFGGAAALALGSKTDGVFIEIAPELVPLPALDPSKLGGKKPKPGTGPRTALNRYLDVLGKGLASYSDRPDIDWTFMVIDSPTANAYSGPGGYVFVTTGLLARMEDEAELAGVLAHEIGHVTGRHSINAYRDAKKKMCIAVNMAAAAAKGMVAGAGGSKFIPADALDNPNFNLDKASEDLITGLTDAFIQFMSVTGYGKENEYAADRTAAQLLVFAGYEVKPYQHLLVEADKEEGKAFGFSNHPAGAERVSRMNTFREAQLATFDTGGKAPAIPADIKASIPPPPAKKK